MKNNWLILLLSIASCQAMNGPNKQSNTFERLTQQAEEQYQKSHAGEQQDKKEKENNTAAQQSQEEKKKPGFMDFFRSEAKPILSKHKEFSDEWWKALFGKCKGCENPDETIDCKKLLNENPAWKEVQPMSAQAKSIIMKRALQHINEEKGACHVACAVCAGSDPNEREDGISPHTALHMVSGEYIHHFELFKLLLSKGANPNLRCIPLHPLQFEIPELWKEELKKYGAKLEQVDKYDSYD